jgi:cytochrome c oxidase cbb3-type subunit I/II
MPSYPWLLTNDLDISDTEAKMNAMVTLGVPYTQFEVDKALFLLRNQAEEVEKNLRQDPEFVKNYGDSNMQNKEIVALIAYLQRLGTDIKKGETAQN